MKVSIFSTCLVDMMFPNVGIAMVECLERLGVETDFPESQVCCGQPTYNSGYMEDTKATLRNQLNAFKDSEYVVGPSGSCVGMMREYKEIFKDDPEFADAARELSEKTYEFSQFIYRVLGVTDVGAELNGKATYHRSCHMTRILGEREAPFELLDKVKGLEMVPLPHVENCCGFGGTFSVKMPEVSEQMVSEKVQDVIDTEAEILISADMGCLMNIGGKFNRLGKEIKIMHIAEVLNQVPDKSKLSAV
ncbi:(Fe-S)-binding protein [Listeria aquatica]|uniref:(Fe-S)-binding protein n=1 Tax=Listeria aquatica TaxID=1494960 RepID=A0A841ZQ76_9LIST|nr:(Fe-S)-binding protein [Listeria aquatica]MBC1522343.1 (Fe-S)-binding protein [Listeria aquatica]